MARDKGTFNLSANFEPIIQSPLDARMLVGSYTDLVLPATWEDDDNLVWLFNGAIVVVAEDPSSGIYWLKDLENYTDYASWERVAVDRGVVNVGDGSVGVFAGYDSEGNIELRTLTASGAATVTQMGDNIIIGLDASFAGEVNYGENVGAGDVSIYAQKVGDALQFRELKAGQNISLDVSNNVITVESSGSGIDGGVWITDITPTWSGNVGDKVFSSSGVVLNSCLTDTVSIDVDVLALPGHTNYEPSVYINSNPVTIVADPDKPIFTGTYSMVYNFLDASITVVHEDGASWSTTVNADTPASIQSAEFTGGYPGSQTELKAGDTFDVSIVTDVSITSVIVDNFGAATGGTYSVSGTNVGFTITIADRGDVSTAYGLSLRVVKATGSTSATYLTTSQGSVDGKDIVYLNDLHPTVTFGTITYPLGQSAIKSGEDASVVNTVTNYDTLIYSSPTGELSIGATTTYESPKSAVYSSGTYNISIDNLRIVANRAANDATTTNNETVYIANTPATLTVVNGAARFRSGGNDGTAAQDHSITIQTNQNLLSAPTLASASGGGTWQGAGFIGGPLTWTRDLQVHDDDSKGTYNWGAILGTNLAGIPTVSNSGAATYVLGGFVTRTITVPAFGDTADINVEVVDYTKTPSTLAWTVTDLTNRQPVGTTGNVPSAWTIDALNINPTAVNILDQNAAASSSQASSFTISESI